MWEELKTFIEVVEQQSFTKAAQKVCGSLQKLRLKSWAAR